MGRRRGAKAGESAPPNRPASLPLSPSSSDAVLFGKAFSSSMLSPVPSVASYPNSFSSLTSCLMNFFLALLRNVEALCGVGWGGGC